MKRMRTSAAVAAGVVASAILVGAPVGAQEDGELPIIDVNPTSGPVNSVITITGEECLDGTVSVRLIDEFGQYDAKEVTPGEDGAWTGQLTIFASMEPGFYLVDAYCDYGEQAERLEYEYADFEVTEPTTPPTVPPTVPPTTPPETPPTTVKPSPAKPSTPAPTPAKPIVKDPGTLG